VSKKRKGREYKKREAKTPYDHREEEENRLYDHRREDKKRAEKSRVAERNAK
jgi:hypothetical protein